MVEAGVELELLVLEMVMVVVKKTAETMEMVSAGRWMMTFLKELLDQFLLLVI